MAGLEAPRVAVREVACHEWAFRHRLPFRYGAATITGGRQAVLRVRVERADGSGAWGAAAETLAPKWFDKSPGLSDADNMNQLRASLRIAAALYRDAPPASPFRLFALCHEAQRAAAAAAGLNPLVACFGPALLDRCVIDGLGRLLGASFATMARQNLPGIDPAGLAPDLAGFDIDGFLGTLAPAPAILLRHTVGLLDPIEAGDQSAAERVGDGLPETLAEVAEAYRPRWFKLKLGGAPAADRDRLERVAASLDRAGRPYQVTLDGNEQFADLEPLAELWRQIGASPRLARLRQSVSFIEQPLPRSVALGRRVDGVPGLPPLLIDESDERLDSFPAALSLGYRGVSSKACKGLYRSMLNAARCRQRNAGRSGPPCFMSAEDLTTLPGLALQQDLALAGLLGLAHVERNGHHYVDGMAGRPADEQRRFLAAHPDLYEESLGAVRLRIEDGRIATGSLGCPGMASGAEPAWDSLEPMAFPAGG
jgi:hypothetical protein